MNFDFKTLVTLFVLVVIMKFFYKDYLYVNEMMKPKNKYLATLIPMMYISCCLVCCIAAIEISNDIFG